jgi:hypothetical protein
MMWGTELQRAEEKLKENPVEWQKRSNPENKKLITLQAYYHRLQRTHSEQNELDECLPIARALFSEEAEKAVQDLNHQFWLVQIDAESLAEDQGGDPEFTIKLRRGVSDVAPTGEVNEMTRAIDGCINTLERICLPELSD